MKTFYSVIGIVAVVGAAALWWMMKRPTSVAIPIDVVIQASDTAGFSGYYIGSETALVEVSEYGDYQCPFCQSFAVVQFPTIKSRLVISATTIEGDTNADVLNRLVFIQNKMQPVVDKFLHAVTSFAAFCCGRL